MIPYGDLYSFKGLDILHNYSVYKPSQGSLALACGSEPRSDPLPSLTAPSALSPVLWGCLRSWGCPATLPTAVSQHASPCWAAWALSITTQPLNQQDFEERSQLNPAHIYGALVDGTINPGLERPEEEEALAAWSSPEDGIKRGRLMVPMVKCPGAQEGGTWAVQRRVQRRAEGGTRAEQAGSRHKPASLT